LVSRFDTIWPRRVASPSTATPVVWFQVRHTPRDDETALPGLRIDGGCEEPLERTDHSLRVRHRFGRSVHASQIEQSGQEGNDEDETDGAEASGEHWGQPGP
jgi:hypothetical protein